MLDCVLDVVSIILISSTPGLQYHVKRRRTIGNQGEETSPHHSEDQLAQLRRHVRPQHGEVYLFVDREAGQTSARAQFHNLFASAARREFQVVLVWALARFVGERVADAFESIQMLLRYDIQFVSYTEPHFRTNGPAGALIMPIAGWILQQEHRWITPEFFDERAAMWRREQDAILRQIQDAQQAAPAPVDQAIDMLSLTSQACQLFMRQSAEEQRRLLRAVIKDSVWQDGTLRTTLFEPFEILRRSNQESRRKEKQIAGSGQDLEIWLPR